MDPTLPSPLPCYGPLTSGYFDYDYKEANKCGAKGIEGGPNWCMSEGEANATYRAFNFPHHTATYYALYNAARYTSLKTYQHWSWYLHRAANTTIKFGALEQAHDVGVMDDTVFLKVLNVYYF